MRKYKICITQIKLISYFFFYVHIYLSDVEMKIRIVFPFFAERHNNITYTKTYDLDDIKGNSEYLAIKRILSAWLTLRTLPGVLDAPYGITSRFGCHLRHYQS